MRDYRVVNGIRLYRAGGPISTEDGARVNYKEMCECKPSDRGKLVYFHHEKRGIAGWACDICRKVVRFTN